MQHLRIPFSALVPELLPEARSVFDAQHAGAERAWQRAATGAGRHAGRHAVLRRWALRYEWRASTADAYSVRLRAWTLHGSFRQLPYSNYTGVSRMVSMSHVMPAGSLISRNLTIIRSIFTFGGKRDSLVITAASLRKANTINKKPTYALVALYHRRS